MNPASPDSDPLVYCARRPDPPLGRWVECLWLAQGYADSARYKVLPNGVVELIINLGDESHGVVDPRRPSRVVNFGQSWVAGLQLAAITVESLTRTALIGVRFLPGGATALLALPAAELTNQVVGLEAMLTREAASIRERLLEPATTAARFDILERWLLARLGDAEMDPAVAFVCAELRRHHGNLPIRPLIAATGWSHKRVLARFHGSVGATPKALARVYRLQRALELTTHAQPVDWSQVAIACGYADQSHFNHDFVEFTGLTPSRYAAARVPEDPNHVRVE